MGMDLRQVASHLQQHIEGKRGYWSRTTGSQDRHGVLLNCPYCSNRFNIQPENFHIQFDPISVSEKVVCPHCHESYWIRQGRVLSH